MPWVELNGERVPYRVEIRRRRTRAALQIGTDGTVLVLLPPGRHPPEVEDWIRQKSRWIAHHRARALEHLMRRKTFVDGEAFDFLGKRLHLKLQPGEKTRAGLKSGSLWVTVNDIADREAVRHLLVGWYRERAAEILARRVRRYAPRVGAWPRELAIRDFKSRWGQCREDGRISFNWRIVQAPLVVVDYVVVHELAHRTHLNHALPFWHKVSSVMPDYQSHRDWLRMHGREFFW